jgi:hypothetical protein
MNAPAPLRLAPASAREIAAGSAMSDDAFCISSDMPTPLKNPI